MRFSLKRTLAPLAVAAGLLMAPSAHAFCGFYVAGGDAKLFNEASKVVMVRDLNRTVLTMVNDFQGDVKEFAMVIPSPTVLKREQIHVTENAIVEHLDAYTAPRLVEYFDEDPCMMRRYERMMSDSAVAMAPVPAEAEAPRRCVGCQDRGRIHSRRIRHPDPVGQGIGRPDRLADREQLPHPGRGRGRAGVLH